MNKSTFPAWIIGLLILLALFFLGIVSLIVYLIFHPKIATLPGKVVSNLVSQDVATIGHSIYLYNIQDPDRDKDGLEDSVVEKIIYKTDPVKFDSNGTGVGDGEYIYNIYRQAFGNNNESLLTSYRQNLAIYEATLSKSSQALVGTESLDDAFTMRALQTYNFYIGVPNDVLETVKQSLALRQNGDYTNSLKGLQDALAKYPDSAVLKYHLGLTYHDMKQYDKALSIYTTIQNDPTVESPLLYSDIASANYSLGHEDQFVKYMQLSIQVFPKDLNQYLKLASYYEDKNQLDDAETILNQGLRIEPRYADYYNALAIIAHLKGDNQKELQLYQKAVSYDFRYAPGHTNISILDEEVNGDLKGALIEAQIALELRITPYRVSRVMELYTELKQPTQAKKYEAQLLAMKNIDAPAYNSLGLTYLDVNNYPQAEVYFRKAIATDPTLPNPYNNLCIVLDSMGKSDTALTFCQKAIQLNPNYANAYSNMGVIYTEKGKYQDAVTAQLKAISLNPNLFRYYNDLGYAYMQLHENEMAVSAFKKALQLGSTDPSTISNLKFLGQ
jgi:tetratricopeptide (TPR) repeat protein